MLLRIVMKRAFSVSGFGKISPVLNNKNRGDKMIQLASAQILFHFMPSFVNLEKENLMKQTVCY